jgi:hypothetical protein
VFESLARLSQSMLKKTVLLIRRMGDEMDVPNNPDTGA